MHFKFDAPRFKFHAYTWWRTASEIIGNHWHHATDIVIMKYPSPVVLVLVRCALLALLESFLVSPRDE